MDVDLPHSTNHVITLKILRDFERAVLVPHARKHIHTLTNEYTAAQDLNRLDGRHLLDNPIRFAKRKILETFGYYTRGDQDKMKAIWQDRDERIAHIRHDLPIAKDVVDRFDAAYEDLHTRFLHHCNAHNDYTVEIGEWFELTEQSKHADIAFSRTYHPRLIWDYQARLDKRRANGLDI